VRPPPRPAELYGPLLHQVQVGRLLPDGKDFVDMPPRRAPAAIMQDFARLGPFTDAALRRFVADNFTAPAPPPDPAPPGPALGLQAHIAAMWPRLARPPLEPEPFSSALALPAPYLVAGGRFRELYYWDSFFSLLGLLRDGQAALAQGLVDNCLSLIERFGHVPNGARTYYLGRSQPPVFHLMARLAPDQSETARRRRLMAMQAEHRFWLAGAQDLAPGEAGRRCVRLAGGGLLNRYWDDFDGPREESWAEDVQTASGSGRDASEVFRALRAGAESGWDFSSRWLAQPDDLGSIRTIDVCPIDLNCLLWNLERTIAKEASSLGDQAAAAAFEASHRRRGEAIGRWLWSPGERRFGDLDWRSGQLTPSVNAAALSPLFVGLATRSQAEAAGRLAEAVLLAPWGLRATTLTTGQQWDAPNGWAPLQWIAVAGLRRYGQDRLAKAIADRWLTMVDRSFRATGVLLEKYDVETGGPGEGGEYAVQDGFGWTNGVTRELLAQVSL
jgi:alpha,alpha-trehalase